MERRSSERRYCRSSILNPLVTVGTLIILATGCASTAAPPPPGVREAEILSSEIARSRDGESLYLVTVSYDDSEGVHATVTTEVDQLTFVRCRSAGQICVVPRIDHSVTIVRCD